MIEKIILDYLTASISYPVYMEKPNDAPDEYILIEKTAGGFVDGIQSATLAIQTISRKSLLNAASMCDAVKWVILRMDTPNVGGVRLNSDYNFTDATTKEYRYQAVFNFYY